VLSINGQISRLIRIKNNLLPAVVVKAIIIIIIIISLDLFIKLKKKAGWA
jgi:hypothetical protein